MGQAKLRGSFEQRQAEGIVKREQREAEQERKRLERLASMTPEQKQRLHDLKTLLATISILGRT